MFSPFEMINQGRFRSKTKMGALPPMLCLAMLSLFSACLFETKDEAAEGPGYVSLELRLKPNASALLKAAAADTVFRLDSLAIELSSSGQATTTYKYAISGRADTGNIAVTAKVFSLASLRTWKARIWTIDTAAGDATPDTVHRDSVTFTVKPGDTTFVTKTVNPLFAILRARLVSNAPASITNPVKYVRIRVDGTTRDSVFVGAAYRSVDFGNSSTGIMVGDSGTVLRSTNGGLNWTAATSVASSQSLCGVSMPSTNTGYAVGKGGTVLKTTNGTVWNSLNSGVTTDLNATYWSGGSNGWIVGEGGLIRKSTNGTSFSAQTSGVTVGLNGAHFSSASNGGVVGDNGTILRTTNGGSAWSKQTSGTTRNLNAIWWTGTNTGFAVGDGGTLLRTLNASTWSAMTSGTTANLRGIFCSSTTECLVVGDGGTILGSGDGGATWSKLTAGTAQNLYAVCWTTNFTSGVAIGAYSAVTYSTDGSAWSFRPIGTKSFDILLAYKYFTPNVSHTLYMDAIDTLGGSLRGYQVSKTILLSPGKDTTVTPNPSLTKCGYSGFSSCQ